MNLRGQFLVLKSFTLRIDETSGKSVLDMGKGRGAILGDYHAGHSYKLTAVNRDGAEAAQAAGVAVIIPVTDSGLTL